MSAADASVYDADLADPASLALLPLEASPWLPLYRAAADRPLGPVVDLGCGTGRFAHQLYERGHLEYEGIDFSVAALAEATHSLDALDDGRLGVLGLGFYRFTLGDLRSWQPGPVHGNTIFFCLETLEHLDDDLDLVLRIPPGHRFVFSVPTWPGPTHVRCFPHVGDVWDRYQDLLDLHEWRAIGLGGGRSIHLLEGYRRASSWT